MHKCSEDLGFDHFYVQPPCNLSTKISMRYFTWLTKGIFIHPM